MSDIFISHKAEEADAAARLVKRLRELGYDVWSAAELNAGEHFETEITARLDASRAVVVLWSKRAIESEWVRAEAEAARRRGIVVPAVIDDLSLEKLPLLYRNMHISDLRGWQGGKTHPGYKQLVAAIVELIGRASPEAEAAGAAAAASETKAATDPVTDGVDENELWDSITSNPDQSADEYRSYLKRFGTTGRYSELAQLRLKRLEREAAHRRWNWGYVGSALVALGTIVATVIAFVQWVGENPDAARWATSFMVTEEQKQAQATCRAWFAAPAVMPVTNVPETNLDIIATCKSGAEAFGAEPDLKATLALAYMAYDDTNDDAAKALVEAAAPRGSVVADYALGLMYLYGWVYTPAMDKATGSLKRAADAGYARADGVLCEVGINLRGDLPGLTDGVRPFCQRGADRGDPSAKRGLGYLLVNGFMGPRNPTEARKLFEASAADGDARGQYQLALLDLYGAGQDPNYAEARELFEQSARHGIAAADRQIGVMYECGLGVPADEKQAALHYDMAYGGGDNVAAYLTGANMAPGRTNEFGPEAQDTLDLSQLGDCEAANRLMAFRYSIGYNLPRDEARALALLEEGAAKGSGLTLFVLGSIYGNGTLVPRDVDRAFALHMRSAETGVMLGEFAVGVAYQFGWGTAPNMDEAVRYFRMAEAQGMVGAAERLRQLGY